MGDSWAGKQLWPVRGEELGSGGGGGVFWYLKIDTEGKKRMGEWVGGLEENQSVQFSCSVVSNSLQTQGEKSAQFSSVAQSCLTLCDPMDCSTPGFPVHHQLPELAQTHVHCIGDAIQLSHPLSSPSPPAFNLSQHQSLFQ